MILDKVDMKSLYLPNLKYEKDFINYPPLPADDKAKEDFKKGYELFNTGYEEAVEASIPYLKSSAEAGNYISHDLLSRYYLREMQACYSMNDEEWENANKNFMKHCNWLQKANLPAGYYLIQEFYSHYAEINEDNLSHQEYESIYDDKIYHNMIKALELGSHDLMYDLSVNDTDLEWAFGVMLLTGESTVLDDMFDNLSSYENYPASPRNVAILKLALMLGSEETLSYFLMHQDYDFFSYNTHKSYLFFQDPTEDNHFQLMSCGKIISTRPMLKKISNQDSFLIPEIDKYIPASTVLHSPYSSMSQQFAATEEKYNEELHKMGYFKAPDEERDKFKDKIWNHYLSCPYKDPRSKYSTIEHKIAYRKLLEESDWINALVDYDIIDPKGKAFINEKINILVERSESDTISDYVYEYLGYANALKKRELEMNPYYYKLARPYIFPEEVYKNHPEWY
ncbi:MAG: hypothetical protein SPF17_01835 [Candidatus Mucispirillum faecigallinarum]|nr:hypothetical protein [Candidatus Mucispirillum faecigallinarum]